MSSFLDRLRAWDRWEPPVQGWGEIVKVVNAPEPVSLSECADEIERLNDEIERLNDENARLREAWMMEKQVGVRAFEKMCELAKALQKIAQHPTGGVGCNPVVFVKEARAALAEKEEK